jgi:hypothetical protein
MENLVKLTEQHEKRSIYLHAKNPGRANRCSTLLDFGGVPKIPQGLFLIGQPIPRLHL